jgi:catechol 2,3-dioxygenase-like lactoylglutathione lyase family enzyme
MEYKLELMCVPVTDVDRAKAFYVDQAGFHADHDQRVNESLRFVQLTPPGSGCSICIGEGLTTMAPGSLEGLQLVVSDVEAARKEYLERGLDIGEIDDQPWGRFLHFTDPDGNSWNVQQIVRVEGAG